MRIKNITQITDYIFLISTSIFLGLGSIGIYRQYFLPFGIINALFAIAYKLIQKGSLEIPKNFALFIFFLLVLLIHTSITNGNFIFFWLFLSGSLYWLAVYNIKNVFKPYFSQILIVLGMLMGVLYFYSLYSPINISSLDSLFSAPNSQIMHGNIGDLWAVVLTILYYLFLKKKSPFYIPMIILGCYFLAVSYSRSAMVATACGIFYISLKEKGSLAKNLLIFSSIGLSMLFIYAGMLKDTLFSRPYFMEAVLGFTRYPFGTGIGNFSAVSSYTNFVHNIILEIFSGMGIFSIIFMLWLYKILRQAFTSSQINFEAVAVFLIVLADYSFNATYLIPSFIWIWFISLGLIEEK